MDLNEFEDTPLFEEENDDGNPGENNNEEGPEESNGNGNGNRPFMIAIGVLGAVVVLAIIGMIIFVLLNRPPTSTELQEQAAAINAQNTAIALIASQTAEFNQQQATQKAAPSSTPIAKATNTPVIAVATATPTSDRQATSVAGGIDPAARTATVAAFQTQAAAALLGTGTPSGTAQAGTTELPETGFFDEVGLPGLVGAAVTLIIIIILARRLRYSNA